MRIGGIIAKVAALVMILVFVVAGVSKASSKENIRVGLAFGLESTSLRSDGGLVVSNEFGQRVLIESGYILVEWRENGLDMSNGGKRVTFGKEAVSVTAALPGRPIVFDNRNYRGYFIISWTKDGITVVNELPLEEYLYGVVPAEMPASWPSEALKAQAVAARTYALFIKQSGKFKEFGYDILATASSQVYFGLDVERPASSKAVDDTRGQILTYEDKPIEAYFHSSSGGRTESSLEVWGFERPYLKSLPDFDQASPKYRWTLEFQSSDVEQLLATWGINLSRLISLSVLEKSPSGRVKQIKLTGNMGEYTVSGVDLRKYLGLPSTLFEVQLREPRLENVMAYFDAQSPVTVQGKGELTRKPIQGSVAAVAGGLKHRVSSAVVVSHRTVPAKLEFSGGGWGHGVGMSQWGAKALAEQKGYDYRQILGYYYPGAELQQLPQ